MPNNPRPLDEDDIRAICAREMQDGGDDGWSKPLKADTGWIV